MDVSQFSLFDTLTSLEEISNMFTTETDTLEEEEEDSVLHICDGCSFQTEDLSEFLFHIEDNVPHQQTCQTCQRKCKSGAALKKHLTVHQNEERKLLPCQNCQHKALSVESLQSHQFSCHLNNVFSCVSCGYFYTKRDKFAEHLRSHSSLEAVKTAQKIVKKQNNQVRKNPSLNPPGTKLVYVDTSPSADSFKCRQCEYKSNTRNNLQRHFRKQHTKTFQCSKCPYTGSCKSEILTHTRKIHVSETDRRRPNVVETTGPDNIPDSSRGYVCDVCFLVKTSFEECERHKKLHQKAK